MTLADIPAGCAVFIDANVFIYYFIADRMFGQSCHELLERISQREVLGFTSTHSLSNVAHRLMAFEAADKYGWSMTGIAYQLKRHPTELQKLVTFRQSVEEVPNFGVQVLAVEVSDVLAAAALSQQHGLLSGDALIIAQMQQHGLTHLASNDVDFDRVPGLTRYAPS